MVQKGKDKLSINISVKILLNENPFTEYNISVCKEMNCFKYTWAHFVRNAKKIKIKQTLFSFLLIGLLIIAKICPID